MIRATPLYATRPVSLSTPSGRWARPARQPVGQRPRLPSGNLVEDFDDTKELAVVRVKLRSGDQILYPGYVSITPDPTMERNNVMTRTISIGLSARSLRYMCV
ncbi:phage tail tube protein [Pseudomonas fluorescens]|uniref:phage tail tube protein n=1 Tax=Pseudomonas fluorescens TaxID=294 RepID=UPI002965E66C|nr:phage tail tube protein [Pseudomonas fluorescens]